MARRLTALAGSGPPATAPPTGRGAAADGVGARNPTDVEDPDAAPNLSDEECLLLATVVRRQSPEWTRLLGVAPDNPLGHRDFHDEPSATPPAPSSFEPRRRDASMRRDSDADACAIRAFRAADKQVGGGHLYPAVVGYLHTEVGPRLFGSRGSTGEQTLFAGAAALTDMAGWMAYDAGRDAVAGEHFDRAFALARLSDDAALGAHILASMSHLAHHRHQPQEAIQLAQRGREVLSGYPPQPELQARMLAMQARGHAAMGQPRECTGLLFEAEATLEGRQTGQTSPWVRRFDEGSLACEAARCMQALGDLSEAQRQAERIVALRQHDRTRSRAFGKLILVAVLIAQGNLDEACGLAQEVLDTTRALGSYLVVQQLVDLRPLLEPHRADRVVADFLSCLEAELNERVWLSRWLGEQRGGWAVESGA
jgi:tetratricopeptide (TPR) repeat protein